MTNEIYSRAQLESLANTGGLADELHARAAPVLAAAGARVGLRLAAKAAKRAKRLLDNRNTQVGAKAEMTDFKSGDMQEPSADQRVMRRAKAEMAEAGQRVMRRAKANAGMAKAKGDLAYYKKHGKAPPRKAESAFAKERRGHRYRAMKAQQRGGDRRHKGTHTGG